MWRAELKYLITLGQYQDIQRWLKPYAILDSQCQMGLPYLVSSTYFDTPDYYHYWQKKDGVSIRKKYRFRTYGEVEDNGYFEIKYRHSSRVAKQRIPVQKKLWLDLFLKSSISPAPQAAETLYHIITTQDLKPTHLVQYKRLAYIVPHDFPYRITFDFELAGFDVANHVWQGASRKNIFDEYVIMELKPHSYLPLWCYHMLKEFQLSAQSISKYALTLEKTIF